MCRHRVLSGVALTALIAGTLAAQPTPGVPQPGQPTLPKALQKLPDTATAEQKAEAAKALAEGKALRAKGQIGEALRHENRAIVTHGGGTWDDRQAFLRSLALRPDKIFADSTLPLLMSMAQYYSAPPVPGLRLKLTLFDANHGFDPEAACAAPVRELGTHDLPARDLIAAPARYSVNVSGVPDGTYTLTADVLEGEAVLIGIGLSIRLVRDLDVNNGLFERRLEKIAGHDGTKATVRYPFDLARVVNVGKRVWGSGDFGVGSTPYDFAKGMQRSAELLAALEAGRDPLWRAKGDTTRNYWFADAQEIMPYRVYCPTTWDGKSKLPLLIVLHGNTRDHDFYFDRDEGILGKTAEKHGWLVVTPLGYHPNGGYGAGLAGGGRGGRGGGAAAGPARRRQELSEQDALNVAALVSKEYDVDPSRTYLFGHSSGGTGTWYLGHKYADRWAGIGISAGNANATTYPFDRIKDKAIVLFHGDLDNEVPIASSRNMDRALTERNMAHQYFEFKGATHATVVALAIPKLFEYFDKHRAK